MEANPRDVAALEFLTSGALAKARNGTNLVVSSKAHRAQIRQAARTENQCGTSTQAIPRDAASAGISDKQRADEVLQQHKLGRLPKRITPGIRQTARAGRLRGNGSRN